MATANKTPQTHDQIARLSVISILLMLFAGIALLLGSGTVKDGFADSIHPQPSPELHPQSSPGSGTALGANNCLIFYTMDSAGGYTVNEIDCPPEGFPDTVTEDMTLEEKALVILPSLEDSLSSK